MNEPRATESAQEESQAPELRDLFLQYYASIWQLLVRLGVRESDADDAAQEVFWVAARRLEDIKPKSEHSFLYGVATRVALRERRKRWNYERHLMPLKEESAELPDSAKNPEQHVEDSQAAEVLQYVLSQMNPLPHAIFVLFEIEELEVKEIAEIFEIPIGTASSRLRRAREEFAAICRRLQAFQKRRDYQ